MNPIRMIDVTIASARRHGVARPRSPRRSPERARHGRRGFAMIEILIALGVLGVVATIAAQLTIRLLDTGSALSQNERTGLAVDRAAERLRRDIEGSTSVTREGATLVAGGVRWSADVSDAGPALVRTAGDRVDRFEPLPAPAALAVTGPVVTLRLGDDEWAFTPLVDASGGRP